YEVMAVGMLIGAFMTAIYSFRIIFRILPGPASEEAQHLIETGHVVHGEPVNPATGEKEDTDVGYPGEEHHIAEQAPGMKIAMSVLGFLALVGGLVQIPGVTEAITHFLEPVFEDSAFAHTHPSVSQAWTGLIQGGIISILGITTAWLLYIKKPGLPPMLVSRLKPVHTLLVNKWYGDEIVDFLIVRPVKGLGTVSNRFVERYLINGLTLGTVGFIRSAGVAVRDLQSGLLRGYAVLMLFGIVAIGLYFLIRST
ncbi:MAG: NADH-quinone oxidoreductase subunit L, partial [Actinomycetota bacterium]|nr:NADH-quinone oxidoreductase subunit L [Actinomycetota bacterium]